MTTSPKFLTRRCADVRDTAPWSPFAYVARRLRCLVRDLLADADVQRGTKVLDFGCADAPYRNEIPDGVEYVGADLPGNAQADLLLGPDGTVPVPDRSFDIVLSTQVLEHVERPDAYLAECHRVLRPGGSLLLSTHGIMYYHRDPEDYWRWMAPGLRKILEAEGFTVAGMRGVMGLAPTAIQLFQTATYWRIPRILRPIYAMLMQGLIALADVFYTNDERVDNGLVLAVRAVKSG